MILQFEILCGKLKNNWFWFVILIFISLLNLILYHVRPSQIQITNEDLFSLTCYPSSIEYGFVSLLLTMYQFGLLIYIIYIFYIHEFEHSFENIILRVNQKKWIISKIIVTFVFTFFLRLIYFGLIYLYFYDKISFQLNYLIYPIIYSMFISIMVLFCLNFSDKKRYYIYIISFIVSFILFKRFKLILALLIISTLILAIFLNFNFKKYCSKK